MSNVSQNQIETTPAVDPRWKDLYTVGGITCILSELTVLLGIIAYLIWPYLPGKASVEQIFSVIQGDKIAGLMALDFFLFLGNLLSILLFLALFVSLKRVNESYALIALAFGLIAAGLIVPARPIVEVFSLSERYAAATTDAARGQILGAGEALLSIFDGTAWVSNTVLGGISLLISAILMLRGDIFSKATAYVGILTNLAVLVFWAPGTIGAILLFLSLPGYLIWYIQLARQFFRMGRLASYAAPSLPQS